MNSVTNGQTEANYSGEGALSGTDDYRCVMREVERTVLMKMQWACTQLQNSNIEGSLKILQLMDACHQMLTKLKGSK